MNLAEPKSIAYQRLAERMPVGENVRCIKQLDMSDPAYRTLLLVRSKDDASEVLLMKTVHDGARDVFPARDRERVGRRRQRGRLICDEGELQVLGLISCNEHRQDRVVNARIDRYKINKGPAVLHRGPQGSIIGMIGVRATILVNEVSGVGIVDVGVRGVG